MELRVLVLGRTLEQQRQHGGLEKLLTALRQDFPCDWASVVVYLFDKCASMGDTSEVGVAKFIDVHGDFRDLPGALDEAGVVGQFHVVLNDISTIRFIDLRRDLIFETLERFLATGGILYLRDIRTWYPFTENEKRIVFEKEQRAQRLVNLNLVSCNGVAIRVRTSPACTLRELRCKLHTMSLESDFPDRKLTESQCASPEYEFCSGVFVLHNSDTLERLRDDAELRHDVRVEGVDWDNWRPRLLAAGFLCEEHDVRSYPLHHSLDNEAGEHYRLHRRAHPPTFFKCHREACDRTGLLLAQSEHAS